MSQPRRRSVRASANMSRGRGPAVKAMRSRQKVAIIIGIVAIGLIGGSYAWVKTHSAEVWLFKWTLVRELIRLTVTPGPFDSPHGGAP
jgi:hypothetical protein